MKWHRRRREPKASAAGEPRTIGYVIVDGLRLPVTGVSLRGGLIIFRTRVHGPVPPRDAAGTLTVFGEDDLGVCQADIEVTWGTVGPADVLAFDVVLRMENCHGLPRAGGW